MLSIAIVGALELSPAPFFKSYNFPELFFK